jgi:hypothetical protein
MRFLHAVVLGFALVAALGCGSNIKATDDAPTNCGNATCNSATQFCYEVSVGRFTPDVAAATIGCDAFPTTCASTPSCACVMSNETFACQTPGCSVIDGLVTVVCGEP